MVGHLAESDAGGEPQPPFTPRPVRRVGPVVVIDEEREAQDLTVRHGGRRQDGGRETELVARRRPRPDDGDLPPVARSTRAVEAMPLRASACIGEIELVVICGVVLRAVVPGDVEAELHRISNPKLGVGPIVAMLVVGHCQRDDQLTRGPAGRHSRRDVPGSAPGDAAYPIALTERDPSFVRPLAEVAVDGDGTGQDLEGFDSTPRRVVRFVVIGPVRAAAILAVHPAVAVVVRAIAAGRRGRAHHDLRVVSDEILNLVEGRLESVVAGVGPRVTPRWT